MDTNGRLKPIETFETKGTHFKAAEAQEDIERQNKQKYKVKSKGIKCNLE